MWQAMNTNPVTWMSPLFCDNEATVTKGDDQMKTWNQIFIRQGFRVKEIESNTFDCSGETKVNLTFFNRMSQKNSKFILRIKIMA